MDDTPITVRKYTDFDEMKAEEYRYWQSRPIHERVAAVSELAEEGYKLKGFKPDAFRLQRSLVHFERQFKPNCHCAPGNPQLR